MSPFRPLLQRGGGLPVDNHGFVPFCGHNEVRKLISKVGFQLKGTGWYETDFKDKKSFKKPDKTNTQKSENSVSKNKATTSGGQKPATSGEAK